MYKKIIFTILFLSATVINIISMTFSIYYLITEPKNPDDIFNITKNSVVEIMAEKEAFGTSYGTGIIIADNGTIITNAHVISYKNLENTFVFDKISIRLIDEQNYREVSLIKYDLDLDIAVLKLNCDRNLSPIKMGDDTTINYGDKVYAIGNMSNYGLSFTTGYISTPHINIEYNNTTRKVIQCNLTISDGNSGGALLDKNGKLIGITTFRLKDQSNNVIYGICYCIPINTLINYIQN